MRKELTIAGRKIGEGYPVFIVAEMSANHNMDYNRAVEIMHQAKQAGADAIKIQTYTADTITIDSDKSWFQINQGTLWDGTTLHRLYEKAYTPWEWQPRLKEEAEKMGLIFFSAPFDLSAVDFLEKLEVPCYKVASFELNDIPMIRRIAKLGKPILMATGVAYEKDIRLAIETCKEENNDQIILLKCTSAYPAPFTAVNLKMIPAMAKTYDCLTGFSDHTMGCQAALGAAALGACVIEKHLTLKREDGGADAAFSMEPAEFKEMCEGVRVIEQALGRETYELSGKQRREREHSRSLFVTEDIKAGEVFTQENMRSIRPAFGLHTRYFEEILGKRAVRDLEKGTPMRFAYVEGMEDREDELGLS